MPFWLGRPKQVTVGVLVLTVLIGLGLVTAPPTWASRGIARAPAAGTGRMRISKRLRRSCWAFVSPVVSQKMAASTVSGTGLPVTP